MLRILCVAVSMALVGCSMTLPVRGSIQNSTETFSGSATGYMDGSGILKVTSSTGVICSGSFVYVSSREGKGVFTCDDNRSGPFEFVSTGTRGTGSGDLGNERMTFIFGD